MSHVVDCTGTTLRSRAAEMRSKYQLPKKYLLTALYRGERPDDGELAGTWREYEEMGEVRWLVVVREDRTVAGSGATPGAAMESAGIETARPARPTIKGWKGAPGTHPTDLRAALLAQAEHHEQQAAKLRAAAEVLS